MAMAMAAQNTSKEVNQCSFATCNREGLILKTIKYEIQLKNKEWLNAEGSTTRIGKEENTKNDQNIGLLSMHAIRLIILFRERKSTKLLSNATTKIDM